MQPGTFGQAASGHGIKTKVHGLGLDSGQGTDLQPDLLDPGVALGLGIGLDDVEQAFAEGEFVHEVLSLKMPADTGVNGLDQHPGPMMQYFGLCLTQIYQALGQCPLWVAVPLGRGQHLIVKYQAILILEPM